MLQSSEFRVVMIKSNVWVNNRSYLSNG